MSEGRFWRCRWAREGERYRVWVERRPGLEGSGDGWQSALDALCERICLETGDGEPNLSFDPPEPVEGGDARHAHPDWLSVDVNGYMSVDASRPELFEKGFCEGCGHPQGSRTSVPLVAREPGEGDFCWPALTHRFLPAMCSERFVGLLSDDERAAFEWLPVVPAPRTRKRYTECIPRRLAAPVAVRGWTVSGGVCPACGGCSSLLCTSAPEIDFSAKQIHTWVAGEDLPTPARGVVALGDRHSWLPLFPAERARALVAQTRGTRASAVGLAPAGRVVRRPEFPPMRRPPS